MSILDIISLLPLAYLAVVSVPLILVDMREHRLPNKIVLPFAALSFTTVLAVNIANQDWFNLTLAIGLPLLAFILGIIANYADYIGMGDVKLLTALLLAVGVYSPLTALWIIPLTVLISLVVIIYAVNKQRLSVGSNVPLGPWLLLSTWIVVALANSAW